MLWIKRFVKIVGVGFGLVVLLVAVLAAYLRLDKENVFYETRGDYHAVAALDSWQTDESEVRHIELRNERGDGVTSAYYRRPLQLAPDYRIIMIYAGAKTREKILNLIPDRPNVVLVAVQYPYESPEGLWQHLGWPGEVRRLVFRAVAGGMLAVSFLQEEEKLDLDRLAVVGVSVGGPIATIHGALDERVPTVVLIHAGGDLPGQVLAAAEEHWLGHPAAAAASMFFDTFEPLDYIDRISPRRLLMIAGRDDAILPVENVEKLFEAAGEPKSIIWTDSGHVHTTNKDLVAHIVGQLEQYLK